MGRKKLQNKKKVNHVHLGDLPKSLLPRNTKAKDYLNDLIQTISSLGDTNRRVQYSSQISSFNIKSITQKLGFYPHPPDVFREIGEFVYHYENYCFRLYVYREKLLQFINAVLPVGYKDNQVRIEHILINPIVKQSGLLPLLEKFKTNGVLSKVINDRKDLTHRLYYGQKFDHYFRPKTAEKLKSKKPEEVKKWFKEWLSQITTRATNTNNCERVISTINNSIAQKIIDYKRTSN